MLACCRELSSSAIYRVLALRSIPATCPAGSVANLSYKSPPLPPLSSFARSVKTLPRARFSRTLSLMEVHFTPEQEAKLAQSAAQQGRNPDELVRQVVARYFDEESRFVDAVRRGEEALQRGEYLSPMS
jgi:predicted transcriptional regulator